MTFLQENLTEHAETTFNIRQYKDKPKKLISKALDSVEAYSKYSENVGAE